MPRQNRLCCPRSMKDNPSCIRNSYGAPPSWGYNVLLFGLLFLTFVPDFTNSTFTAPAGCTSVTWKLDGAKVQNITCSGQSEVPTDGKEGEDVVKLNLANNQLTSLAIDEFKYFVNLIDLDLSGNQIPNITVETFSNLTRLQYLNLTANPISTLPSEIFTECSLVTLDLSHLNLGTLDKDFFKSLTSLLVVDLSYNNISTLEKHLFKDSNLETIDLSNNVISTIDQNFLNDATSVTNLSIVHLDLSSNQLTTLHTDLFKDLDTIETLDVSNNMLTTVPKDIFQDNTVLSTIDFSHNKLNSLDKDLFKEVGYLDTLYLNDNLLYSLPAEIFQRTVVLRTLYLNDNVLTSIDNDTFAACVNLEYVNLSGNDFNTISTALFTTQTSTLKIDFSSNPFMCDCTVRDYFYTLEFDLSRGILNEDDTNCDDPSSGTHVYLDYDAVTCSGNLGANCTMTTECMVRDAKCDNLICVCADNFYDKNGNTTDGGQCENKIQLDYSCPYMDAACSGEHVECVAKNPSSSDTFCLCKQLYYDNNPLYPAGTCYLKVELGDLCTSINNMCRPDNSECDSTSDTCGCLSTFYSSNGPSSSGGECLLKKILYSACNETYQCGTDNAECSDNTCSCSDGFYDFTGNGECQGPSGFFSCYPDNTSDTEILFAAAEVVTNLTECEEYCFIQDHRYYHMEGNVCICGDLGTTIDGCCRYASSPCKGKTYLGPTTALALAGINITHIPQLHVGSFHEFSVTTDLHVIDEIRWRFGDSQSQINVSGTSDTQYHTYTYSGLFWLTVSACIKVENVCEDTAIPVFVQVPPDNLTTYITSLDMADVSSDLSNMIYATFSMGYNFQYYWYKDYNGDTTKKQGCTDGWTAHRHSCIKLMSTPTDFNSAKAACAADGQLLQIDFMAELLEIVTALNVSSEDLLLGALRVGGVWQWSASGSKTVFSDADLTNPNNGDCVVLEGTSVTLTSSSCTTYAKYACITDPVSCPKGGELMSNGHCYVLASMVGAAPKTWIDANEYCSSMFGGWLSNITDAATQTVVTGLLVNAAVSEAYFGLSDFRLEGYYMWADDTSFNFHNADYMPSVTSNDEDCFVTTNSSTWSSQSCSLYKDFVCQYSENIERLTVPSFMLGVADLGIPGGQDLQQVVATDSFPSATASSTTILLFPGLSFSRKGNIRSWIFHSIDVLSGSYDVSLQVYRPTCQTGSLYQPGCASSKFSSCSGNTYTCAANTGCTDLQYFCYLSSTCKFINESCTCNTVSGCATAGTMPDYQIIGQTSISVTLTGENVITVPAGDTSIEMLDIIGIQFPTGQIVIKCESIASGSDQQMAYSATTSDWLLKRDPFPASYSTDDITCYLQAIYTQDSIQSLPPNIGYSSSVGNYDMAIRIVDTDLKTLSLQLEESADDIYQLYPPLCIASSSASSLGSVCTEMNQDYDFSILVGRGTELKSTWSFDTSQTVLFSDSCVTAVASAVGDSCNASLVRSDKPYASFRYNTSSIGSNTVNITISNVLGSEMRTLIILTEKSISVVAFSLVTPSLDSNTVAINKQSEFATTVADGTGLEYSFAVGGSPAASTNSSLIYSFTTTGTFNVEVTVANILGTQQESIDVFAKHAADFQNCKFMNIPYTAAVGIPFSVILQCDADVGSEVSVIWILSDRVSNTSSATSSISSVPNTWTESFTFTSVSNVLVAANVRDPFEEVSVIVTVSIYNAVPSVSSTTNSSAVFSNVTVQFTAIVPAAPGSYGIIDYSFDFGDGSLESSSSGIVTHAYNTSGNYTISVVASNGPSSVSLTSYVTVYEPITGLSLTYDGPKEKTSAVSFTASVTTGNFLSFEFVSSPTAVNETVTTDIYSFTFATAGEYNITVRVSNALSEQIAAVKAYIMEATDLILTAFRMDGVSVTNCIETTVSKQYSVEIIHYDATNVVIDWDFGDGTTFSDITSSKSYTYNTAGNYTITVTVEYSPQSVQKTITELICVQERISSPAIMIVSPIALPPNNTVTRVVTVFVATGGPLKHVWSTNATAIGSTTDATFSVQFSTEGAFYVAVNLSNEINYETVTEIAVVQEDISSMAILCASCIEKTSEFYVQINTAYTFTVATATGTGISFSWDYGDTSSGTGVMNTHTYTAIGNYNLEVTGSSLVTAARMVAVIIHVETIVTDVTVTNYYADWLNNIRVGTTKDLDITKTGKFLTTIAPTGMDIEYYWIYETGLDAEITMSNYGNHHYTTIGQKSCTVTASNSLGNKTSQAFDFYVIEKFNASSLQVNENNKVLTNTEEDNTFKVALNEQYTFTMTSDQVVPNTEHYFFALRIKDGALQLATSDKKNYSITYTFTNEFNFTLDAKVENSISKSLTLCIYIECIKALSGPFITGTDGNVTLGSSITLSGGVAEGKYPEYKWFYAIAPAGETLSDTADSVIITPGSVGEYIVTLEAFNSVSSTQSINYTINVMIGVSGVGIDVTMTYADAVEKGTNLTFTATVTEGTLLSYSWNSLLLGSSVAMATTQTFTCTFSMQALYNITLYIENYASSGTAFIEVYSLVNVPGFTINVSGATYITTINKYVAKTNDVIDFSSSISDTDFLQFDWTIDGVAESSSETLQKTITNPAEYVVELNASNKISSEKMDIDVIVQAPLTGFSITGCTGTYLLGTMITLTASQTTGTDVSVEWSREDIGNSSGLVTTVSYAVGVYSVNVTGSNYVSTDFKLCYITIQGAIDSLQLNVSEYLYVGFPITFTVTGNSHINPAVFRWEFSHGVTKTTTDVATIDETFLTKGNYTLTVTVSNDVSNSSVSLNVTLEDLACNLPVMTMDGSTEHKALRARPIEISVDVSTGGCSYYTSVNKWTVYSTPSCADALTNEYVLESTILTNTPNLLMPSHSLLYGTYCVVFQHSYNNTPVQNNIHVNLTIVASDLMALGGGGDELTAHEGSMLTLDARDSYDPDDTPGTTINYAWSCTQTIGTTDAADVCASVNAVTLSYANVTGLTLNSGDTFNVAVTVSALSRNSGTKSFTLSIHSNTTPILSIFFASCNASGHFFLTSSKSIAIEGTCISACTQSTIYQWTVTESSTGTAITIDSTQTTTGTNQLNFVLMHSVLLADKAYTFKLEATEGLQTGYAVFTLLPSSAPSVGTCTIDKDSGIVPLQDIVTITCQNVVDSDPLSEIYFKIELRSTTTYSTPYILYYGTKSENELYVVPFTRNGTIYENVNVTVTAINDYGAETDLFQKTISFTAPTLLTGQSDYTAFMVDQMGNNMGKIAKKNNPPVLLHYCTAALSYLNILSENNDGTSAEHMAIRDLIAYALNGLPLATIYDIQTMASTIKYLAKYSEEISTNTLGIISSEIEVMADEMVSSVVKGDDQRYYDPSTLISTVALMQETLQAPSTVTSDADVCTKFGDFEDYVLAVSTAIDSDTYSSEELRKQAMIEKSMDYNVILMMIPLMAQLADENAIEIIMPDSVVYAKHVSVDKITREYNALGTNVMISDNVLSQTTYSEESVFQLISVSIVNPYDFGSSGSMPLNTKTLSTSFHSIDGDYLAIDSLAEDDEVVMYMFASNVTQYAINNTGLVDSTDYDPFMNMNYTSKVLEGGKEYDVALTMPNETGVAVHFQMRVNFTSTDSILKATLYKNDIAYTTSSANMYSHPLTLTKAMMDDEYLDHRNYTFYIPPDEIGTTNAFKAILQLTKTDNFTGGQYFSKCQYFDVGNSLWDSDGCTPQAYATASVISCRCNHMTSFGGSLLVSPDQLDFTDLTRIDVASNPVAIITCSVIVGLYIILVVVFRRLDILDVKRISLIPLCGKDGSFKYEVTIVTGRIPGAGTTAHIGVRLSGEYGKSARQHISKAGAFQRNCSDTFIVAYDVNLGDLRKIQIWHDNRGMSPSWYLSHVIVNDMQTYQKYYFFGNTWLSLEVKDATVHKELRVAGGNEMSHFGYRLKTAMFNSLADKHLWLSLFNRPAQSRFTRVQRVTCCVTILFTFVGVNAMWYGLLKKENTELGFEGFGWEEVVLALVSNVMVLPVSIGLVFLFKKSRSKANIFDNIQKPQTAQTLEIENLCENSQGGSFESNNTGAVPYDLERESTIDSVPHTALGLHRSRHVAKTHRENTDESMVEKRPTVAVTNTSARPPLWNEDGIMQWPDSVPKYDDGTESRPSTGSTSATVPAVKQPPTKAGGSTPGTTRKSKTLRKGDAGQLLEELDKLENDLKESETRSVKSSRKSSISLKKPTMHKSQWGSLEDILQSDDESIPESSGKMKKRGSTTSQGTAKRFTPRADPRISRNVGMWSQRKSLSGESTVSSEGAGKGITAGLRPGYYSEMMMESRDIKVPVHKKKCTLPSWCIYIAYILCFMLSVFSGIIVILYCFKFGYEESLEWVLALILSLILSVLILEPLKAVMLAVYVVAMFQNVEQDEDDDYIDIEPTFDNSHEKIKDVKFKPISGFALLQAKEEGRKIHRMNVIIRQFIAYVFYLLLIMVIVFVNFRYDSYLMTKHVQNDFIAPTTSEYLNFTNITSIDEFWDWSENVFVDSLYKENLTMDEEHGFLLGAARMRLIRGLTAKCVAANAAVGLGASSLTDRTCHGEGNYDEDTGDYAEAWNESASNYSWRHYTSSQLGSTHKLGHIAVYGGGGYPQVLGTSQAETDSILSYLKDNGWIDLQTRAVIVEFSLYSPGTDVTSLVALLAEFPLTGGVITSYEIQSQKLLWYQKRTVDSLMVLEGILLLVIMYTIVHTVLQIREHGKQYFKDMWNWYEILTTLMALVSIGLYIGCVVEATNTFNNYLDNREGFTNFERAVYVHVGMRYLHAWLLFLLMYKVVRQMRFIKFMYVYERTLSTALGHLLGTGLIYVILLLVYAQVGYLMYGQFVSGFQTVGHSISTLIVMIRGNFDFWLMLDHQPIFSHFYVYSYYVFAYGIMIALVISILTSTYKVVKSQMYYTATLEMQDYEMINFMMKRFKLWSGIQKPKPAFRRVRFPGLPSVSSRSSSSCSNRSSVSLHSAQSVAGTQFSEVQLRSMMARMVPTWQAVLKRMDKIMALDDEEATLVKRAENEMKDLNWKCRINELERQHKELLGWKNQPSTSGKPAPGDAKQRQSILKRLAMKDNHDRKAPATVTGAPTRTATSSPDDNDTVTQGWRPLSDQGARVEQSSMSKRRSSSTEKSNFQTPFKSIKPSKSAWNT